MALRIEPVLIAPAPLVAEHARGVQLDPRRRARGHGHDLEQRVPLLALASVGPAARHVGDLALRVVWRYTRVSLLSKVGD